MTDENVYRKRFLLMTLARLGGLAIFFLGVAIIYTDFVRPGGAPAPGAVLIIVGALDVLLAPRVLKRAWEKQDQ